MEQCGTGGFTRSNEWFESEGLRCAAAVFRPEGAQGKIAAVVMAHGFGTPRAVALYVYAEESARNGYAVVVFDYRHFGESEGEPRQLLGVGKQLQDWRRRRKGAPCQRAGGGESYRTPQCAQGGT